MPQGNGGVVGPANDPTSSTASGVWGLKEHAEAVGAGTWPGPILPFEISRSLRFNPADTAYLQRTLGTPTSRRIMTYSFWAKRSIVGSNYYTYWNNYVGGNDYGQIQMQPSAVFQMYSRNSSGTVTVWLETTSVYRDVSSWYHFVIAFDTTQSTASDRVKLYVNGEQITSFGISTYPSQNTDVEFQVGSRIAAIGRRADGGASNQNLEGLLADYHFIDGQALTPSDFGEVNATTGVWSPIAYTGSYGNNGFHLDFSDNSSTSALGIDSSGNSNDWTPNNFSVTAGAGNDSLVDSPTQYGTDTGAGGEVRGNYCTLNPLRQATGSGASLANGNLQFTCISASTGSQTTFATFGVSTGKWYFEMTVGTNSGYYPGIGVNTDLSLAVTSQSGDAASGYMYLRDGSKYNSGSLTSYGASYTTNDVVGVALDMDAGTITFYKNGSSQGQAFSGITGTAVPCVIGLSSAAGDLNFGQRPFAYTAPSGFKALCTTNLPDPTVVQGDDYFNTVLYTGNGSTQSITGVGFEPSFVWFKARNVARSHRLVDAIRGVQKDLFSDTTGAENTPSLGLLSFDSDGFTVGGAAGYNANTETQVAWNWNAGGSNATNTDGTITSTVRANTTAGISIVSYTGVGPGSAANEIEVGHGLGAIPKMVIVKVRSTTGNWFVFTTVIDGSNDFLYLNTTDAAGNSGNTAPTSDVFYAGGGLNTSSATYIAYCFAEIPGFSAFGKYTGNGSSDGIFAYLGFRPAWLLLKETSGASNWILYDNKRDAFNVVDLILSPNLSNAESSYSGIDFVSNGFKFRSSSFNSSGATYIYAAFAENPFKYALAR